MKVISNLLSANTSELLLEIAEDVAFGSKQDSVNRYKVWTNLAWDKRIVGSSSAVICIAVPDNLLPEIQDALIDRGVLDTGADLLLTETKTAMIYVWTNGSYIPPHKDSTHGKAVTVYLNKDWGLSDGGLFCWKDSTNHNQIRCVEPSFNLAVENSLKEEHFTTPVTNERYPRVSVQIFISGK